MILGIDPGKDQGWALVSASGLLQACGLGDGWKRWKPMGKGDKAILEHPQIYPRMKVPPQDVVVLALRAGRAWEALVVAGWEVELVLPTVWKGQIPKLVHHRRIRSHMTEGELKVANGCGVAESLLHNVMDAIGLAKWGAR